jgi:hypothetical protein
MRLYLDNNILSERTKSKSTWPPAERAAIDKLLEMARSGKIILETSRHTGREMERVPAEYQAGLKAGISDVQFAKEDHKVMGSHTQHDQLGGCISNPQVTDIVDKPLYRDLRAEGLDEDDAKHLMYAVHNGYTHFVTYDRHFLEPVRRANLERRCPSIKIHSPSEVVALISE